MIELNGKRFYNQVKPKDADVIDPKVVGSYRAFKRSINLYNRVGVKIGVINQYGVLCHAQRRDDGRWWYSFATIDEIGEYDSYMQSVEEAQKALSDHGIRPAHG
tara:strand:- start:427 stop:738 length:312 start_codon:yes stop_codon:yes gene_type:complete